MRSSSAWFAALSLVLFFLFSPAGARADERRGAELVVTRLDGSRVSGELIAVKPGSLLLLAPGGTDASVDLTAIRSVRIVRKSQAGPFAGVAGGAGFLTGALLGLRALDHEDEQLQSALLCGCMLGAIGAVSGLLVGGLHEIDSNFAVAGQPEDVLAGRWKRLGALSREGRRPGGGRASWTGQRPGPAAAAPAPASIKEVAPSAGRRPRFRLGFAASPDSHVEIRREAAGSFRFPGQAPDEAGPYGADFRQYRLYPLKRRLLPSFSLAYELTPQIAFEAEFVSFGGDETFAIGDLVFVSSLDGRSYLGTGLANIDVRFSGIMAGLAVRPFGPSAFRRHVFEFGAAIGPAWARGEARLVPFTAPGKALAVRRTILAGRIRAAYDFYPVPSFALGAVAGWRFARTSLTGLTAAGEAYFGENASGSDLSLRRLTEVAFPPLPVTKTGFYWGLRIGVRI